MQVRTVDPLAELDCGPETGLEEINSDLLEDDFRTAVVKGRCTFVGSLPYGLELEFLRCNLCGEVYSAEAPK